MRNFTESLNTLNGLLDAGLISYELYEQELDVIFAKWGK